MKKDDEEEVFEDYDYFLFSNLEDIREEILKITQNREESLKARIRKVLQIGASAQRHYEEGDLIDWDECEDTDKVCVKDEYELFRKHMRFLSEELELLYQDWDDVLVESEVLLFDQGNPVSQRIRNDFCHGGETAACLHLRSCWSRSLFILSRSIC